jgi:cytoskeletal protein CcmA (bactofilin family)
VSSDVTITGDIISSGDVQIDGKVKGNTRGASITVGETANLEGEVVANEVIVRGHILGTLRANRVQLCKTAHVEGDILHEALIVETGAFFEGNCRHSSDPMNGAGAQRKAQPPVGDSAILNAKPTEQPDARSPKAIGLR